MPTVRCAAVQMEARLGDINGNIAQACDLVERAVRGGAQYIALPEFFTTPIVLDESLHACGLERNDNRAVDAMRELACSHDVTVGGSFLEFDNGDLFNTYVLCRPDGTLHRHRKDLPTMVECAYYVGGDDEGLVEVSDCSIGIAVCWEIIRAATVNRLRGRCDLIMSGSHWWSAPDWRLFGAYLRRHARLNAEHMLRAPGRFARMVGAPMLHGAHCGQLEGRYALTSRLSAPMRTHLVGEAQIVDAGGAILARRGKEDGASVALADVRLGPTATPAPPQRFWLEPLPLLVRAMWVAQNHVCRQIYRRAREQGKIKPHRAVSASTQSSPSVTEDAA